MDEVGPAAQGRLNILEDLQIAAAQIAAALKALTRHAMIRCYRGRKQSDAVSSAGTPGRAVWLRGIDRLHYAGRGFAPRPGELSGTSISAHGVSASSDSAPATSGVAILRVP